MIKSTISVLWKSNKIYSSIVVFFFPLLNYLSAQEVVSDHAGHQHEHSSPQQLANLPEYRHPKEWTNESNPLFIGLWADSVVHLVWNVNAKLNSTKYILEKSVNGGQFEGIDSLEVGSDLTLQNARVFPNKRILLSDESGRWRAIYNDYFTGEHDLVYHPDWKYRVKEVYNGKNQFTNTVNTYQFQSQVYCGSETYREILKRATEKWQATYADWQNSYKAAVACENPSPPKPPGFNTIVSKSEYDCDNCKVVRKITWEQLITQQCTCQQGCCVDNCLLADNTPIHSCSEYSKCSCTPWPGCGPVGSTQSYNETTVAPKSITVNATSTPADCSGNLGTATATVSGGTGPFTYNWSPSGGTDPAATDLNPGNYTVTVTDPQGCTGQKTVNVGGTVGAPINFTITAPKDVCVNANMANIQATGTIAAGSTYAWNFGPGSTKVSGTNNSKGPFTVKWSTPGTKTISLTVTQPGGGCGTTKTLKITVWALPAPAFTAPAVCLGSQTIFDASATPVNPKITSWSWNFGDGATGTAATTAFHTYGTAGAQTVTLSLTNEKGCSATITQTVTVKRVPDATMSSTPSQCNQTNGTATAVGTGGTNISYTYSWNPSGQTTSTATGLGSGIYVVTVTDKNGCTKQQSVNVGSSSGMTGGLTRKHVTCPGFADGEITVSASGGTPPYTFLWANGETTATIDSLTAGAYPVTITDAAGCSIGGTINITEPTKMGGKLPSTTPTCNGGSDGTATAIPQGGFKPYTYLYSDGQTTQTSAQATGLSAGITYTITVTDSIGCKITVPFTISEPPKILTPVSSTPTACAGKDIGTGTVTPSGGKGWFTYVWSDVNQQTDSIATGLAQGTYTVTVKDSLGCEKDTTVTIGILPGVIPAAVTTSTSCGTADGTATASASAGAGPYTYSWLPGNETTPAISGLLSGNYTLTVTDANGCDSTIQVIVPSTGTPINASVQSVNNVKCYGGNDGSATIVATGGNGGNFIYSWVTGGTTDTETGLEAGIYNVTIKDTSGCRTFIPVTISQPDSLSHEWISVTPLCGAGNDGKATIRIKGGTPVYAFAWSGGIVATDSTATGLSPGSYSVTVTDANNCSLTASVAILAGPPAPVLAVDNFTNVSCNGGNNGTALVQGNGGTGALSYQWSPGTETTNSATQLAAGTYTVTVADVIGCTDTKTVTITEPTPVLASVTGSDTICAGQSATLTSSASGGTSPYNYSWNPGGSTDASIVVTPAANTTVQYIVTVTDANGCTTPDDTAIVVAGSLLNLDVMKPMPVCTGNSVTLSVSVTGGDGNYTYTWMPGSFNTPDITVSPATTTIYTVTVNSGCGIPVSQTDTAVIHQLPVVAFSPDLTEGCVPLCVIFKDNSTKSVSYSWTFGDGATETTANGANHCYRSPGDYSVSLSVIDSNGCTNSLNKPDLIHVYPEPTAIFSTNQTETDISNPFYSFTNLSIDGGTSMWSFGDPLNSTSTERNPSFTYADTGTYRIELIETNQHGCDDTTETYVHIKGTFAIYVPNTFTPNGDGKNDSFMAKGVGIATFEMIIYDRWGNLLYETRDMEKPWDGRANGGNDIAQIDTYIWKITVTDLNKKSHRLLGHVNIIR